MPMQHPYHYNDDERNRRNDQQVVVKTGGITPMFKCLMFFIFLILLLISIELGLLGWRKEI